MKNKAIPTIDLFAGPGGLGEGFAKLRHDGHVIFDIRLSVECDVAAHSTLELRSLYRKLAAPRAPDAYYDHLRGSLSRQELFARFPDEAASARADAWRAELGSDALDTQELDNRIRNALKGEKTWVLVGGPPCQAYSLAGRARNFSKPGYSAENDPRHFLYREYLRIIAEHQPSVFVMENVKGMLSSKVGGESIFARILDDLREPTRAIGRGADNVRYRIYSLSLPTAGFDLFGAPEHHPSDFIVESERYGVPQKRHRVLLLGVHQDLKGHPDTLHPDAGEATVRDVIADLPRVRAGVSGNEDSPTKWKAVLSAALESPRLVPRDDLQRETFNEMRRVISNLRVPRADRGAEFVEISRGKLSDHLTAWYSDKRMGGVLNHSTRSHMPSDFHRYLWASCFAKISRKSPVISDFPRALLPAHRNVQDGATEQHFADRFRVQVANQSATTVMSHIAKDGHYYIHFDPSQCRSLTVREAARLQTFPDNYFFCGNRTEQYTQVGNAVPPYLAWQIAEIVRRTVCDKASKDGRPTFSREAKRQYVPDPRIGYGT